MSFKPAAKRLVIPFSFVLCAVIVAICFGARIAVEVQNLAFFAPVAKAGFFDPVVTAAKTAVLQTDANGKTLVNRGDTLRYSVVVNNGAAAGAGNDAPAMVFTD